MNDLPVNLVDAGVAAVILLSALVALSRGLVREVLSVGAWVVATLATVYGLPHLRGIARSHIEAPIIADSVTGAVIFVVTLILCTVISHMITRHVRSSGFGALDRSLGLLFGVARGAIVVCLAYLAMVWAMPKEEDRPEVVKSARSLKYVAQGAELMRSLLPKDALDRGAAAAADAKAQVEQAVTGQMMPSIEPDKTKPTAPAGDPGYNANERKDLDKLIKSNP